MSVVETRGVHILSRFSLALSMCFAILGCEEASQLSDDVIVQLGEFTPHDMAECAGLYRASETDGLDDIATVAAKEAGRSVYGWSADEAESAIEEYRANFRSSDRVSETVSKRCGEMFGLMSRIWERQRAEQ